MASSAIHLAIAKKYMEKNKVKNPEKFLAGTLYPDACEDNDKSHYTDIDRGSDNISHIRGKVNLFQFLENHETLDDFELGWFLHLVTDYLFFEDCFDEEYLRKNSYKKFCEDLYFAYKCLNLYISEKYHITKEDYKAYPKEEYEGIPYQKCIFPKSMINKFIEQVSDIDLNAYIDKLKKMQKNRKPSA